MYMLLVCFFLVLPASTIAYFRFAAERPHLARGYVAGEASCLRVARDAFAPAPNRFTNAFLHKRQKEHNALCLPRCCALPCVAVEGGDEQAHQSSRIPKSRISLPHLACSRRMVDAYSSGVLPTGSTPASRKRFLTSGLALARATSCCTRVMMAAGVCAGAKKPNTAADS